MTCYVIMPLAPFFKYELACIQLEQFKIHKPVLTDSVLQHVNIYSEYTEYLGGICTSFPITRPISRTLN